MLSRLLTLLVCLLVLLPQRVCICAKEVVSCSDKSCPVAVAKIPAKETRSCSCRHHEEQEPQATENANSDKDWNIDRDTSHQHERHHSDCPSVNAFKVYDSIKPVFDQQNLGLDRIDVFGTLSVAVCIHRRLPYTVLSALDPPRYLTLQNWRN